MKNLDRRDFISQGLMGLGSALIFSRVPFSGLIKQPIGFQVFPIRDMIVKDFGGTLKMMANLGYQTVEMCSPPGYISSGFGPILNMKAADMRHIINDAGLTCQSCHYTFGELKDNLDERMEFARQLGLTQMICSSFWLPKSASLKDYLNASDELNKIGEKTKKGGFQMGYHNHEMEFAKLDNIVIYDAIMGELDPELVKMQFQTEVINLGYKASTYFKKYPGRFISTHMSDWTNDKKQVPIGQGIIDWKDFFNAAKTGGVKNFYVEMDMDTFRDSVKYIQSLSAI
jgi:sugar phosphate isomerase/epimerase